MNLLLAKRRRIDKINKNSNILPSSKYTILKQNYDYVQFIFHFVFDDNLYDFKISQNYINDDVDKIIKSFINEKIKVNLFLKIEFHQNHPFECPIITLEDVENNLNIYLNNKLKIYFNYIIYNIYKKLNRNWSPILPMNVLFVYIYNLINIKDYFNSI